MDISLKHENYKFLKKSVDNSVEETIEAELSLPEYMPEILRIIKTTATPKIISANIVGDRLTVDGVCDLRLIYTAEDNCVYTFSVSKPFVRYLEKEDFNDCADVNTAVKASYVNCKATGTKRVEIKTGVSVKVTVFKENIQDIISLESDCNVQEKSIPLSTYSLGCKKTKSFSLSDTVNLDIPSAFVISCEGFAVLTETRKINNKVMLKGEACVDICYVNYNDKSSCEEIRHTLPINQILEYTGMEERFDGAVDLQITALDVTPKGEQGGATASFDIALGVDASVNMWEEKEVFLIADAYSTECSLDLTKSDYVFYGDLEKINETFIYDGSFSVHGEGVSCIANKTAVVSSLKCKAEEGSLTVNGTLALCFIIKDNASAFSAVNKDFDFTYQIKNEKFTNQTVFEGDIKAVSLKVQVKGENTVQIKSELNINGCTFKETKECIVTDIVKSDRPFSKKKNAITVYFPDNKNESLWGIARRYNTTVKAIAEENDLQGETTEDKLVVFIP